MHNDIYVVASTAVIHQKDSGHQESEANIRRPFARGTDAVMVAIQIHVNHGFPYIIDTAHVFLRSGSTFLRTAIRYTAMQPVLYP